MQILTLAAVLTALAATPLAAQQVPSAPAPDSAAQAQTATDQAPLAQEMWAVLDFDALMPILRDEALAQADSMAAEMFPRGGTGHFREVVGQIHEPARLTELLQGALAQALTRSDPALIERALAFYGGDLGQRMIGIEIDARRTLIDPDADSAAQADADAAFSRGTPRSAAIQRLIERGNLIEPNVAGAMNASLAFSQGFAAGEGHTMPMSETDQLREVWSQEPQIRADTESWLRGYLMLAYSPLSDDDLADYTEFAGAPEGQALSDALFAAFDTLFQQTSRDMGLAAAAELTGREL